jgi:hypothetical protein
MAAGDIVGQGLGPLPLLQGLRPVAFEHRDHIEIRMDALEQGGVLDIEGGQIAAQRLFQLKGEGPHGAGVA